MFFGVGFFVLLGMVMKGKSYGVTAGGGDRAGTAARADQPSTPPSAVPQAPQPDASGMAPITDKDWVKGDRNAPISVVEYSDLECPFCKRVHPTLQQLVAEYGGKVNWVYRHFPLTQLHPKAVKEAEAAECAGELGGNEAFWKYVDRLYEVTPSNNGLEESELPNIAEYAGLTRGSFEECLNSGRHNQKVMDQAQDAVAAGGSGTPYNVIVKGDTKIPVSGAVPIDFFKARIDPLLK
jgi:protein-disulfide isomerase